MKIKPAISINGSVAVPGDKSISHRAAIIAALARGRSRIQNFSSSQDCESTLRCLEKLGVVVERQASAVTIESEGRLQAPLARLDCGNSGSTMRMLAGVLAGHGFTSELTGDQSLCSRPMIRIIEPLERMSARIESTNGNPPLLIAGRASLDPIIYDMPIASAQVKSCVLLAGMNASGRTGVIERQLTRDHTERLLNWFEMPVVTERISNDARQIEIEGPIRPRSRDVIVPGDISSAAFLIAAGALLPGSDLQVNGVGLNPTRTQFLTLLQQLRLNIRITALREVCNELVGDVRVIARERATESRPELFNSLPVDLIPQLIDELPLLAIIGTQIKGGMVIRGSKELRFKESDRISATVKNLHRMGAEVEEFDDGLSVFGPQHLSGAELDSFGDHRIAMAFTVAALLADGESFMNGADCVAVSFPQFFQVLESITRN